MGRRNGSTGYSTVRRKSIHMKRGRPPRPGGTENKMIPTWRRLFIKD
jgi:hypothetical protein